MLTCLRFAPRLYGQPNPYLDRWRESQPGQAAVLLLFVTRDDGLRILLTERQAGLRHHAGQMSLPGGRVEDGETAMQAALRETWEEVGLPGEAIELWGRLDTNYVPPSNFMVEPYAGLVLDAAALRPGAAEVQSIVEMPVPALFDGRHTGRYVDEAGRLVEYFEWHGHRVWGATARMLNNLCEVLGQPCLPDHLL